MTAGDKVSRESLKHRGEFVALEIRALCAWAESQNPEVAAGALEGLWAVNDAFGDVRRVLRRKPEQP